MHGKIAGREEKGHKSYCIFACANTHVSASKLERRDMDEGEEHTERVSRTKTNNGIRKRKIENFLLVEIIGTRKYEVT